MNNYESMRAELSDLHDRLAEVTAERDQLQARLESSQLPNDDRLPQQLRLRADKLAGDCLDQVANLVAHTLANSSHTVSLATTLAGVALSDPAMLDRIRKEAADHDGPVEIEPHETLIITADGASLTLTGQQVIDLIRAQQERERNQP